MNITITSSIHDAGADLRIEVKFPDGEEVSIHSDVDPGVFASSLEPEGKMNIILSEMIPLANCLADAILSKKGREECDRFIVMMRSAHGVVCAPFPGTGPLK